MIKAVIFDCFGVLAEDGWLPFKRTYIGNNQELSNQVADLGKQNEYGYIDNKAHQKQVSNLLGVDAATLSRAVDRRVPNEELFACIESSLRPKYKIGLLSNANYDVLNKLFEPSQAALIDASVLSYETRLVKPDTRMYELIANRLGVAPAECVYIDDQERYCTAAVDVGMQAIWHTDNESTIKALRRMLNNHA